MKVCLSSVAWFHPHNTYSRYRCVGLTTVDLRVCGSPGRDKVTTTDKKGAFQAGKGKNEAEGEAVR